MLRQALADGSGGTEAIETARSALETTKAQAAEIPAKVALSDLRPGALGLDDERKRLHDAIRMSAFRSPADCQVLRAELHVRLDPLSAPRRSRVIAALAEELTATETRYPNTELRMVYTVKGF